MPISTSRDLSTMVGWADEQIREGAVNYLLQSIDRQPKHSNTHIYTNEKKTKPYTFHTDC